MDPTNYLFLTYLVIFVSFIAFIVFITVHIAKKQKPTKKSYIILFFILLGMYLFVPNRLYLLGAVYSDPELLQKALKLSINPRERSLCNYHLGEIYGGLLADERFNLKYGKIIDGNKAIEYYEKAFKNYKYKDGWNTPLINLYLLKGDYDKVIELDNSKSKLFARQAYIMQDKFNEALKYYTSNSQGPCNLFLRAALLEKVGNVSEAKTIRNQAEKKYAEALKNNKNTNEYKERVLVCRTIESYKNYINNRSKAYGFIK